MPEILKSEEDRHDNSMSISSEDDDIRELPRRLTEIIGKTEPVLEVVFGSSMADLTTFGEPLPAALPVPSAVYTACMAYLLTWKLVLSLIAEASAELRPKYSAFLRKNNYLRTLMDTLFHIMPMKVCMDNVSYIIFQKSIFIFLNVYFFLMIKIHILKQNSPPENDPTHCGVHLFL